MKRFTLSVVMTAVLGLAAYTMSGAQGPGRGPGPRSGGPGFGPGPMSVLRDADLTEQQQAEIRALREADRASSQQRPVADGELQRQLQAELFADAPDPQKIAALQQQVLQVQAARLAREIAIDQKIAQVLTAEQRAKVRERLTQPPQERGRRQGGAR